MKVIATLFKVKTPAEVEGDYPFSFIDRPELLFRAVCPCPFTGEHVEAAGDSPQGALYALGQSLRHRQMLFTEGRPEQAEVSL
jgi:hypothetical protein